jgi:hypothetical protein
LRVNVRCLPLISRRRLHVPLIEVLSHVDICELDKELHTIDEVT